MLATKPADFRLKMSDYMEIAYNGEPVTVARPQRRNVVVISESLYNQLEQEAKLARNAAYLAKLDKARENHANGDTISFSLDELEAMENPGWKPTPRVLAFEKAHGIKRHQE